MFLVFANQSIKKMICGLFVLDRNQNFGVATYQESTQVQVPSLSEDHPASPSVEIQWLGLVFIQRGGGVKGESECALKNLTP